MKPGRFKTVWQVSSQLLYGQVIKRYQRRKVVRVEQRMAWGERTQMTERLHQLGQGGWLNTAFVERLKLTLRRAVAALSRKSWATFYPDFTRGSNPVVAGLLPFCQTPSFLTSRASRGDRTRGQATGESLLYDFARS
jgi:hypothetical protein